MSETRWMSTNELAERLSVTPVAVKQWRSRGTGPNYHRFAGTIRYCRHHIAEWEESCLVKTSQTVEA